MLSIDNTYNADELREFDAACASSCLASRNLRG